MSDIWDEAVKHAIDLAKMNAEQSGPIQITHGYFKYHEAMDGWNDTFTVVDDDGMPFALDDLKRFENHYVRITIELAADERYPDDSIAIPPVQR